MRPMVLQDGPLELARLEPVANGENSASGTKSAGNNDKGKRRLVRHSSSSLQQAQEEEPQQEPLQRDEGGGGGWQTPHRGETKVATRNPDFQFAFF